MKKTNAARILDQHRISYDLAEYEVDENDLSAENVAAKVGQPIGIVFKTLVLEGDKTGYLVAVIPGAAEVDLKKLAALSGNKKCWMVPLKNVLALTGYIRGGVSPVGMKKPFPVFMDAKAFEHDKVFVSAGIRGLQMQISPGDLQRVTRAVPGHIS
ncbi:MAG: Cys-tRNA(Pro) deacylase [Bacteroidales bacterium]